MIRLRKIAYLVHVDTLDDEGNVVGEGVIAVDQQGTPWTAYPQQLGDIPQRVKELVEKATPEGPPT